MGSTGTAERCSRHCSTWNSNTSSEAARTPIPSDYLQRFREYSSTVHSKFPRRDGPSSSNGEAGVDRSGLSSGERFGSYTIVHELGRGGMAIVYEAHHAALGRSVALKVLPSFARHDSRTRDRFVREAQAVARLRHGSIVPIFDVGAVGDTPYYSMQLVEGHSLSEGIASESDGEATPFPDRCAHAVHVALQVARALEYAHSRGVLHRDVKPSNILVDSDGAAWVVDFGLAKVGEDQNLTTSQDLIGTLRYMPPERFAGFADERGDVYSLGLTLFELLALRPAYLERDQLALMRDVMQRHLPPLRRLVPEVPRDLEKIVAKATARHPGDRYVDAGEFAADLERFRGGHAVLARPIPAPERLWRWMRRNPVAAALVTLLIVSTLGAGVAARVFRDQATTIAEAATRERGLREAAEETSEQRLRDHYRSQMERASAERSAPGGGAALPEILRRWQPRDGEEDLRGFEWFVLHAMTSGLVATLPLPHLQGGAVDWDPRGGDRVVGTGKGGGSLWDAETGEHLRLLGVGSHALAYWSPGGEWIASTQASAIVRVICANTGEQRASRDAGTGGIRLAWYPDDRRIAIQIEREVYVWDWVEDRVVLELADDVADGIAITNDGTVLATRAGRDTIVLSNAETGESIRSIRGYRFHHGFVFDESGGRLAAGTYDNKIHVFDVATGDEVQSFDRYSESVDWTPDGHQLIASGDTTIQVWDVESGRLVRSFLGHEGHVFDLAVDPRGERVASTSIDGTLRLWSLTDHPGSYELDSGATGGEAGRNGFGWSVDGDRVVISVRDRRREFDLSSFPPVMVSDGRGGPRRWSPDGRFQTVRMADGQEVYDENGDLLFQTPVPHSRSQWSADGDRLLVDAGSRLLEFQVPSGVSRQLNPPEFPLQAFDLHTDGRRVVGRDNHNRIHVVDTRTGEELLRTEPIEIPGRHFGPLPRWEPHGERIAVAIGKEVRILSAVDGNVLNTFRGHGVWIRSLRWSPDGSRIAAGDQDKALRLFDPDEGLTVTWRCEATPYKIAWSANGQRLGALLTSGLFQVWEASAEKR